MAPSGGQICNKCKRCHVVAKFNPSHWVNFWVRCASGNVFVVSSSLWSNVTCKAVWKQLKKMFYYKDGQSLHSVELLFLTLFKLDWVFQPLLHQMEGGLRPIPILSMAAFGVDHMSSFAELRPCQHTEKREIYLHFLRLKSPHSLLKNFAKGRVPKKGKKYGLLPYPPRTPPPAWSFFP